MTKPSGLAAFVKKPAVLPAEESPAQQARPAGRKPRGKGDTVALTIRLKRSDWLRLHEIALSQGTSLQALAERGLSSVMREIGLPALQGEP